MPTLSKSESSRANGAKSRGPKTDAGKQRSSQNAIRHGLTSQTLVLPAEDPADFQRLLDSYLQQLHPAGPVELDLVHEIVAAKWRLNRIALIETQLLAAEIEDIERDNQEDYDEGDVDELISPVQSLTKAFDRLACNSLPFLYRLESRLERTYSRALRNLLQLQKLRIEICTNEPTQCVHTPVKTIPATSDGPTFHDSPEIETCTNEPTQCGARTPACRVHTRVNTIPATDHPLAPKPERPTFHDKVTTPAAPSNPPALRFNEDRCPPNSPPPFPVSTP